MCVIFAYSELVPKDRVQQLLKKPCKCAEGTCFRDIHRPDLQSFLDQFERLHKREQDSVLYMACTSGNKRREYFFLGQQMKRSCLEKLLGISSHRMDKVGAGAADMRFGSHPTKPSQLTASIDSFCCVLYNSVAEPLPTKFLTRLLMKPFVVSLWFPCIVELSRG